MSTSIEGMDFETILANERPRLVRLCAWFTSQEEAAQDLAQETLIAAWKNREQLTSLEKLKPWTSAIARNICLNWSRQFQNEQKHSVLAIDGDASSFEEEFADDTDLELELDRQELATLLDRALSLLPVETGQMLIEHYIQDSSHAAIAEKMNLNPGTVAVRIQRGKLTLQKLFRKQFETESLAYGLISTGTIWEETNIWCPCCGQDHLLGKFQHEEIFALRCPRCDPDPESIMAALDLTKPYHARLLGNTKTYKPAYVRLLTSFAPLYREAMQSHTTACLACGHAVDVLSDEHDLKGNRERVKQIRLLCPVCGWTSNKAVSGLIFSLPEVHKFWREHPRIRTLPSREIEIDGSLAFVRRLQSVNDRAELTVVMRQDSLDPIAVHSNVRI
jgi:RNA polymerase sigma-70 factor (ECF subfamily)